MSGLVTDKEENNESLSLIVFFFPLLHEGKQTTQTKKVLLFLFTFPVLTVRNWSLEDYNKSEFCESMEKFL